jgi:16S rRNA processing protein RimM
MSSAESTEHFNQPAGSPGESEPVFLAVGKLRRTHGIRGDLMMEVLTDFPERLRIGLTVYVGETHQALELTRRRAIGDGIIVAFQGFETPEQAVSLRNELVYVRADDRPELPEGEYYHHQVIGLHVVSDDGQSLGPVTEIMSTGANDIYVVRLASGKEVLLPAIESVVLDIDLTRSEMRVHLLPGLMPE